MSNETTKIVEIQNIAPDMRIVIDEDGERAVIDVFSNECVGDLYEDGCEWYQIAGVADDGRLFERTEEALVKFECAN